MLSSAFIPLTVFALCLSACDNASEPECNDVPALPATNADALFEFSSCRGYIDWPAESASFPTAAPHGDATRVYINPAFEASLQAGNIEHPVGSMAVKEIFTNGELSGWAAMIKVEPGVLDNNWYWYEVLDTAPGTAPVAAATGVSVCVNCHRSGTDFLWTNYPLR